MPKQALTGTVSSEESRKERRRKRKWWNDEFVLQDDEEMQIVRRWVIIVKGSPQCHQKEDANHYSHSTTINLDIKEDFVQ